MNRLASNKSILVTGISYVLICSLFPAAVTAVTVNAEVVPKDLIEAVEAQPKAEGKSDQVKAVAKSEKPAKSRKSRTHFGMGYEQRNRYHGSSMGGSRQQGKGRGRR